MKLVFPLRIIFLFLFALASQSAHANSIFKGDDGYRLWLRYDAIENKKLARQYKTNIRYWQVAGESDTNRVIRAELSHAFSELLGGIEELQSGEKNRLLLIGTPKNSKVISALGLEEELNTLGNEGYLIKSIKHQGNNLIVVTGNSEVATLYGSFHLLRLLQTQESLSTLEIKSRPKISVRTLNHWDNPDRHVERGYAGQSIWDWHKLPEYEYQRYYDYARANASIGLNGTVLNNVNANPIMLTPAYLKKVKALADIFRPYGIKVYLSIKFSSPQNPGSLKTSDPLDPKVQEWWRKKAREIYEIIPDFGGFLVKANSEGQPGPGDFGRSHAEGANMLADALAPHGGIVMWRAFVYAHDKNEERSKQAWSEFKPLDGQFRKNVLIQVKNGPIDFQPREPFSPLFGATPQTPMMMEFQVTMEYTGFSTHFVYLGTLYEEVLRTNTHAKKQGASVAEIVDGSLFSNSISGIAGVSNIGVDRNWTGHPILQSNWYVFGRLAWDHSLRAEDIAEEWIRMSISNDEKILAIIKKMMMESRENVVNYMTPLGLHHLMATGHHYGPGPWVDNLGRSDWNPVYYHRADKYGIGLDRSPSGENAVAQYHSPLKEQFSSPESTPEELLLWFHHLSWDYKIPSSGRTLWDELVHRYYAGAAAVEQMAKEWDKLEGQIDPLQFKQIQMAFEIQIKEARWWRNACVLYFQTFSKKPIPEGLEKPEGTLEEYKRIKHPYAPGDT